MRAVKGNREYTIDETQKKSYQDMGFDILDDDGNVIAHGRGKTVPYDEYVKAVKAIESLRELAAAKDAEIEALKAEIEELKIGKLKAEEPGRKTPEKKPENKKAGE